jgi:hypothetical protein
MQHELRFPWLTTPVGRVGKRRSARASASSVPRASVPRASVPRMAPAAVRIPDVAEQIPLYFPQIFIHEGARQQLERRFETAFRGPVQLGVTDNRRRMITYTRVRGRLRVRVNMMFLGAEARILDALVAYVVLGDREASQIIGDFIDANTHQIRPVRRVTGKFDPRGRVHDLGEILSRVNETYFSGHIGNVQITWGRHTRPSGKQRSTIKLGSYSASERLIRIHPALDAEWVPRYFVSYIVFHELLHHVMPEVRVSGRTLLHPPEFTQREREFRHHARSLTWEQKHIDRLLRSR